MSNQHESFSLRNISYISTGSLAANEQLPPVKSLAKTLNINFQTVRKAYQEVENDGLLRIIQGEGTFVSLSNSAWQARSLRKMNSKGVDIPTRFNCLPKESAMLEL